MTLTRDDIMADAEAAIERMVTQDIGIDMSYALVPARPIGRGGLGARWSRWHLSLKQLRTFHLPKRPEYACFHIDPVLVDHTHRRRLSSARDQIAKRLTLLVEHFGEG